MQRDKVLMIYPFLPPISERDPLQSLEPIVIPDFVLRISVHGAIEQELHRASRIAEPLPRGGKLRYYVVRRGSGLLDLLRRVFGLEVLAGLRGQGDDGARAVVREEALEVMVRARSIGERLLGRRIPFPMVEEGQGEDGAFGG